MFKYFNFCQFLPPDFNNSNKSKLLEASDNFRFSTSTDYSICKDYLVHVPQEIK